MDVVLWIVAVLALLMAFSARKRNVELLDKAGNARREGSAARAAVEELSNKVETLRTLLERMAGGHEVDALMVREGRLYRSATGVDIQKDFDAGKQPYVVDVRTPQEWATGHIRGAVHIPVDSLETSLHEVKRDGTKMYLICAKGGRSAAAAGFLGDRGYLNVFNVEGGMNSWRGETVRD